MPELRRDPITGEWVIIASERAKRPTTSAVGPKDQEFDPNLTVSVLIQATSP